MAGEEIEKKKCNLIPILHYIFFGQDWFDFWNYPLVSSENKEIKPLKVCINLGIGSILKTTTLKPRFI